MRFLVFSAVPPSSLALGVPSACRRIRQSIKLPIFQLHMSREGVESSALSTERTVADDLDTCSHSARDSALKAEPIQI